MGLKLHTQLVQQAAANNQTKFGETALRLLKRHVTRQMKELVSDVVDRQVDAGALAHLSAQELQLMATRLPELTAADFKLVEAIVEALVPRPTGDTISLENEGINIPKDPK